MSITKQTNKNIFNDWLVANNNFTDLGDVKRSELSDLVKILGSSVAVDVKKQLGEEVKEVPKGKRKGQLAISKF